HVALGRRRAQEERGVVRGHERDALVLLPGAAEARDGRVRAQEALRGELAERDDHARADGRELLLEEGLALGDLVGLGVAVARRAALQDVADVDVAAGEAHGFDHLGQELAGGADERLAGAIFVGAGRFADEDEGGVGVADAVDDVGALAGELAALAVAELLADGGELGRAHAFGGRRDCRGLWRRDLAARQSERAAALEPGDVLFGLPHDLQKLVAIAHATASAGPSSARARSRILSATSSLVISGRRSTLPSRASSTTRLVSVPNPEPASLTSLATIRSHPFCASFSAAWRSTSSVSAAKPTTTGALPFSSARMSGFFVSVSAGASPRASFFSFCGASAAGR